MKHVWLGLLASLIGFAAAAMEPGAGRPMYVEARDARLARIELRIEGPDLKEPVVRTLRAKDNAVGEWISLPAGREQKLRATLLDSKGNVIARGTTRANLGRDGLATVLITADSFSEGPAIGIALSTHRVQFEADKEGTRVAARVTGPDDKAIELAKGQAAWLLPGDPKFREPFDPRRPYLTFKPPRTELTPCLCLIDQPCACMRTPPTIRYRSVTAGGRHSCAIDEKGKAFCWGEDNFGQLGSGSTSAMCALPGYPYPYSLPCSTTPVAVQAPAPLARISAGGRHTCALDTAGAALCWGANNEGQLGIGTVTPAVPATPTPRAVAGSTRFTAISAGQMHTCALGTDSLVYCWGSTTRGQAGTTGAAVTAPRAVSTTPFRAISAGTEHTCGITTTGQVQCWGRASEGQLGLTAAVNPNFSATPQVATVTPAVVPPPAAIAAGGTVTCVGSASGYDVTLGSITCFGSHATIPNGAQRFFSFTRQLTLGGDIAADDTVCALNPSGTAHCWGMNTTGALGIGSTTPPVVTQPTAVVQSPPFFSEIDAGAIHTCGIASDGRVFCWGGNGSGQLGNGSQIDAAAPTVVPLEYIVPSKISRLPWP